MVWYDSGVAGCEHRLDCKGNDDLCADVLDLVNERGHYPSTYDARHTRRDLGDPDLDGVIGVHVERCLGSQRDYGLPNHARDEEDHEMDRKLTEHSKETEGEDRVSRNSKVIEEASDEDDSADCDRGGNKGF